MGLCAEAQTHVLHRCPTELFPADAIRGLSQGCCQPPVALRARGRAPQALVGHDQRSVSHPARLFADAACRVSCGRHGGAAEEAERLVVAAEEAEEEAWRRSREEAEEAEEPEEEAEEPLEGLGAASGGGGGGAATAVATATGGAIEMATRATAVAARVARSKGAGRGGAGSREAPPAAESRRRCLQRGDRSRWRRVREIAVAEPGRFYEQRVVEMERFIANLPAQARGPPAWGNSSPPWSSS